MKKKILAVLLAMSLVFSLGSGLTTLAATTDDGFSTTSVQALTQSSQYIYGSNGLVAQWYKYVDLKLQNSNNAEDKVGDVVSVTNTLIALMILDAKLSFNPDLDRLVQTTNEMGSYVISKAADIGVTVQCELKPYTIKGQTVYIDPLKIINR